MGFAVLFFAAWLITVLFAIMGKKLSLLENTFVYLIILIININWSWIIFEEIKLIKISTQPIDYTAFLINRSITIPFLIVTQLNLVKRGDPLAKSAIIMITSVAILVLLVGIGLYFDIIRFVNWNIFYDILYFFTLHMIAFYSLKYYRKLGNREEKVL